MPTIAYETKNLRDGSMALVEHAATICAEYARQGYDLTLRQLYYQFVARGLIENSQRSYKKLGKVVGNARMAGFLDWDYIVDRTREEDGNSHWRSPASIIRGAAQSYGIDLWADQDYHVEVWIEKDALAGVVERVANRLDVTYLACRGYPSLSVLWRAGQRFYEKITKDDKRVVILHLGDHDPSGIDMTRDIQDRLYTFVGSHLAGHADITGRDDDAIDFGTYNEWVKVERIALNMDQVEEYDPPPNPAKVTDSRARDYIALHGRESWELDALPPNVLADLIESNVEVYRDNEKFADAYHRQEHERSLLISMSSRFSELADYIADSEEER